MREDSIVLTQVEQQRSRILNQVLAGALGVEQAATLLRISLRHTWRLKARYRDRGARALAHANRGRPCPSRTPQDVRRTVVELAQGPYAGCNDSHLCELLAEREGLRLSRSSVRRILRSAGLRPPRRRRPSPHRSRRERMTKAGMLLQLDGSPYRWLGPEGPEFSLLAAIDDATGAIAGAVFREQEDAHGYFLLLRQILVAHGVPPGPLSRPPRHLPTRNDRSPWTLIEQFAGRQEPTQFGRALEELGIGSIAANSPQAKGRIERLWGTLQDRLVAELRLATIDSLEAANRFLSTFLGRFNDRFATPAAEPETAYRPLPPELDLDEKVSFRYLRVVAHDNTVRLDGRVFQIPAGPNRLSYARARVAVHEFLDGSIGVRHGDRWLLKTEAPPQPVTLRSRGRSREEREPFSRLPRSPSTAAAKTATSGPWKPTASHPWRRYKETEMKKQIRQQKAQLTESLTT